MADPVEPSSLADRMRAGSDPAHAPENRLPAEEPDQPARSGAQERPGDAAPPGELGDLADHEVTGAPAVEPDGPTANMPWPRLARADDTLESGDSGSARQPRGAPPDWVIWLLANVAGFLLLLGGYFLGQAWGSQTPANVPSGPAVNAEQASAKRAAGSERTLEAVDRALAAERRRDLAAATGVYDAMLKRAAAPAGAEYRLALLSLHAGNMVQTEVHLNRSLAAGDDLANCRLLSASLAGMRGNFNEVASQLGAAARAEPFSAKFSFCWGESLRRAGRSAEAIGRLTRTLDRPDNAAARTLYWFKLRLAQVEASGNEALDAQITEELAKAMPDGEWLMLAAAREIGQRDFAAAAELLARAKAALPPETFGVYVQDYLYQKRAAHPELKTILQVPPPAAPPESDAPLQDPAVWSSAEADPAVWPPFLQAD